MELRQLLTKTGLTGYEAQVYCALLISDPMTGYEAAKAAGISRSNVYLALEGLMEKGGACRIDGETAKYAAVPLAEYCKNKRRAFLGLLEEIERLAPEKRRVPEAYVTISGDGNVTDKMRNMIGEARERVYLSQAEPECRLVERELAQAVARGLRVVIVTGKDFALSGAELYRTQKEPAQIRLIADSSSVLTGTLSSGGCEASCLYTQNRTMVTLFKEALRREIDLIKLKEGE